MSNRIVGSLAVFAVGVGMIFACSSDGGGQTKNAVNPDASACSPGAETCACYGNQSCNSGLSCLSARCVRALGSGGEGGFAETGGASSGGANNGGTSAGGGGTGSGGAGAHDSGAAGAGGTGNDGGAGKDAGGSSGGTGGIMGAGGTAGAGGIAGAGGTAGAGGIAGAGGTAGAGGIAGAGGTAGAGGAGGAGGADTCNGAATTVVDNFATCDTQICQIAGRSGAWYAFADTGINQNFAVAPPGSGWVDRSCAAWTIGGPLAGTNPKTFAGIGLQLAEGSAYDLTSRSGVTVSLETSADVWFVVKTGNGGYFGGWLTATTGNQSRALAFANLTAMPNSSVNTLDRALVTEFQFTAKDPTAFGFAIHGVSLY